LGHCRGCLFRYLRLCLLRVIRVIQRLNLWWRNERSIKTLFELKFFEGEWRRTLVKTVDLLKHTHQVVLFRGEWPAPIMQQITHDSVASIDVIESLNNLLVARLVKIHDWRLLRVERGQ